MSDEIIAAIIQSIAVIYAVRLGFRGTLHEKKLDWHKEQAKDFFTRSKEYNETVSRFIFEIRRFEKPLTQDERTRAKENLDDLIRKLSFLAWEIRRHASQAGKASDQFLNKCEPDLLNAIQDIIKLSHDPHKGGNFSFDLERIRELQYAFDESAGELHTELCKLAGLR